MLSRRALVGKLAAGAAVTAAMGAGVARMSAASVRGEATTPAGSAPNAAGLASAPPPPPSVTAVTDGPSAVTEPPPWELVRPLTPGALVAHGWRVAELSPVEDGACVLTLRNASGRTHRIHLCRNNGRPQGLVYTERVDLVVMNGGQGDLPTEEGLAQAVAEVAHVLAANESARQPQVAALLPHAERVQRFGEAEGARLR